MKILETGCVSTCSPLPGRPPPQASASGCFDLDISIGTERAQCAQTCRRQAARCPFKVHGGRSAISPRAEGLGEPSALKEHLLGRGRGWLKNCASAYKCFALWEMPLG